MSTFWHRSASTDTASVAEASDPQPPQDEVEREVQRILSDLEANSQEVQYAVCSRLLTALAAKLTPASATKAVSAARTDPNSAQRKTTGGRTRGGSRGKSGDPGRIESRLSQLADPADPIAAWSYFGGTAEGVRAELKQEPVGVLQAMLRHDRMPPGPAPRGTSSASLANTIVARLERYLSEQGGEKG